MTLLMSIALTALVVTTVYLFCLRPMRRGRHPVPAREGRGSPAAARAATDVDIELRRARAELVRLRRRHGQPDAPIPTDEALRASVVVAVPRWRRYLPVNMSRVEQVVRVAAGVAVAVIAALVLPGAVGSGWRVGLAVLSGLVVVDLVVSGLIGHCPLHRFLRMPWEPRRRSAGTPQRRTSPTPGAPADKVSP
ncbi:hypothetical protein JOF29_000088 [Kribbella aluminosa]|uniref:Inner membrane protein YgaP-like transmembrane domain-containing protein n=1 Tax=Kribbella aluminosa TaxID=416017 RepID=A0ABS4UBN4_9ACTN|nr:YgaP-like transmembrane domain [Kribbella aluminosa]MBP2349005.1 hypothetical protein [Kribbella aluminosa]